MKLGITAVVLAALMCGASVASIGSSQQGRQARAGHHARDSRAGEVRRLGRPERQSRRS